MQAFDPLGGGEHRDHPTAGRQTTEQPAALGHQQRAVLEAEHARDTGRRVLADAVAQHHVRFEAPRLPEPGQAHLHREQGGLGVGGVPQGFVAIAARKSRPATVFRGCQRPRRTPGHCLGEHGLGLEQLLGHAGVLAALTREQPRRLRRVSAISPHQTRCRAIVGERTE